MNELDRQLLVELQADPRKSNAKLAKSLGITERSVSKKIEHLVLSRELVFTGLPKMTVFGYNTSVFVGLKVKRQSSASKIAEKLAQSPQIRLVGLCTGFADIFIGGDFKSNSDLAKFITEYIGQIDGIAQINTMVELQSAKNKLFGRIETEKKMGGIIPDPNICIDEIDRSLVYKLQNDGRAPLKKLAKELNLTPPTIKRRMNHLVASGALELTAIPKMDTIGYHTDGVIGIEAEVHDLIRIATDIAQYRTLVGFVGIFSGPIQILTYVSAPDSDTLSQFATETLAKIDGVNRINFLIKLDLVKRIPSRISL